MIIKYTTKKGKEKQIKLKSVRFDAIKVIADEGGFVQVDVKNSHSKLNSVVGHSCKQTAFLGTGMKLRRKVYRSEHRN
mgnify:CR=1 FL=1